MSKTTINSGGCIFVAVLGVILVGVVLAASTFYMKKGTMETHHAVESMISETPSSTVVFTERDLDGGDPLYDPASQVAPTLREYTRFLLDHRTTSLARNAFSESVEGRLIRWPLTLADVQETNEGKLVGTFSVRHQIKRGRSTQGSSYNITVEFQPEQRNALLKLRPGQVVEVEGKLTLKSQGNDRSPDLRNIRILNGSLGMSAEAEEPRPKEPTEGHGH